MSLEIRNLAAGYSGNFVLRDLELTVNRGEVLTLIGPNGCGKSTLLKIMGRQLRPRAGYCCFDGIPVHCWHSRKLAQRLATLPQNHRAPEDMTVEELVGCGRFPHRRSGFAFRSEDRIIIKDALAATRLTELRLRTVNTLSGGERQRAWIALTLAQQPEILLLDEPTTFLDVCCQFEILELIRQLNRELGLTVIMVLHDLNLAARCSDRIATVSDGRIRHCGTPAEILQPTVLRDVFQVDCEIVRAADGIPCFIPVGSCRPAKSKEENHENSDPLP